MPLHPGASAEEKDELGRLVQQMDQAIARQGETRAGWQVMNDIGGNGLFLREYEVWINIGVHDFEKKGEQRVLINVDLYIPLAVSTPRADAMSCS